MSSRRVLTALWFVVLVVCAPVRAQTVNHNIKVVLHPDTHQIEVTDEITLPPGSHQFLLHAGLHPKVVKGEMTRVKEEPAKLAVPFETYAVKGDYLILHYQGEIYHPVVAGLEYAHSFSETPGMIADDGVYLANSSLWYPYFPDQRLIFSVNVELPPGWRAVSQGDRSGVVLNDKTSRVTWSEASPQEEIYLIAARFHEYSKSAGAVEAMAFLREDDPALAQKYLDVTAQYIEMYRQLIGPYPYSKFALVENAWESGYGMPSFTLLGSKVIRLPFILHSSYPHEILHNWWGNGVYVDFSQGNWSEGLTSYLADHLIQEQRGAGAMARRNILQGYTDFVSEGRDFPLTDFRARHSSSSEAVGYGKAQMLFHMLRREVGDQNFIKGLHRFYAQYKFKTASWDDLARVFDSLTKDDLQSFFRQWVQRVGAPQLRVDAIERDQVEGRWRLRGRLEQTQAGEAYRLKVPVAVTLTGEAQAFQAVVDMSEKSQPFELMLDARPVRVDVDPEFDLFRRLHRQEIPAALSQAFGADKALMVLPAAAPEAMRHEYQRLIKTWRVSLPYEVEVKLDSEIDTLPTDRAVWLLGWENRLAAGQLRTLSAFGVASDIGGVTLEGKHYGRNRSLLLVGRHPKADKQAVVWLAAATPAAVPGLARKLPHYRRYSYLVFQGDAPDNIVKGQWPVMDSPMSYVFAEGAAMAQLAPRQALAQLPPVFDDREMLADIKALAAPAMEGRGLGSAGLDQAGGYLAKAFEEAGLQPAHPGGSYFEQWSEYIEGLGREVEMRNVIGIVPGHDPALAGQSVVIGAHYDHLGFGWPDVRKGNKGKLHPGADDNASGVAVMLELARMAAKWQPARTLVFVAFTGEEAGRLGSQYYVRNFKPYPAQQAIGMVNLDTVGRLGANPVTVFGVGSAREWVHIIRGIGFVTGIKLNPVMNDIGSSDQKSFLDAGIPAVQLFGSVHSDYHSPGDTINKIDRAGLVKMAAVLKEIVDYLATRPEPMNATLAGISGPRVPPRPTPAGRKVSMGTVPDFTYGGPGVLLSDVVAGSPAAKAGLKAGDLIQKVDDTNIDSLQSFAQVLRVMAVGQKARVVFKRADKVQQVDVTVVAR